MNYTDHQKKENENEKESLTPTPKVPHFVALSSDLFCSPKRPKVEHPRWERSFKFVGGALGFWILCRLHYGPRITVPRSLRWAACGAVSMSSTTALLVRLFSPECEPQNIATYDKGN
ncbi:PREDICTED: LOC111023254 [Prunus dulcis]|uniref:PREDICTED: LOC111023254 n=1 Tax=Prunus dulcis TaxID=3755 RepID=A0A5E4EFK1_PRUDU|nr:PREDICTED: LOC111023254 [Prunus dulcis]